MKNPTLGQVRWYIAQQSVVPVITSKDPLRPGVFPMTWNTLGGYYETAILYMKDGASALLRVLPGPDEPRPIAASLTKGSAMGCPIT